MPGGQGFRTFGRSVEPTEWLASGIPGDAELTMDFKDEPVVFGYRKSGDGFKVFGAFFPRNIAMYENAKKIPGTFPDSVVIPDAWAMGYRRTMDFKLQYSEQRWQLFPLTEDATDPDAKPGTWEKLPKEIVDAIRKRLVGCKYESRTRRSTP